MPHVSQLRSRRVIDNVMLIAVLICMSVAFTRFALVAATVPYATYVGQRAASEAGGGGPAATESLMDRIATSGPFVSWWARRDIPKRQGGNYLGVISQRSTERTLGCVIGVIAAHDSKAIARIVVPSDMTALYGAEPGTLMTRSDGTQYLSPWASLSQDSAFFSDTPVVAKAYDPVLTAEPAARIRTDAGLVERSRAVFVGAPKAGGSGTWVLHVIPGRTRTYLLVPLESSPIGGAS